MDEGQKEIDYFVNNIKPRYAVPLNRQETSNLILSSMSNVWIQTPYYNIVMQTLVNKNKFETTTFEDAKSTLVNAKKFDSICFSGTIKGVSMQFHKVMQFAIEQNEKYIKPSSVDMPTYADYDPDNDEYYPYKVSPILFFTASNIDYNKPAKLLIQYAGDVRIVHDIDFSKYK